MTNILQSSLNFGSEVDKNIKKVSNFWRSREIYRPILPFALMAIAEGLHLLS
jgi:hypothetical protein